LGNANAVIVEPAGITTTYLLDGRQYVVMPAGSTMTAFALPKK
jgi:hypothetical protein